MIRGGQALTFGVLALSAGCLVNPDLRDERIEELSCKKQTWFRDADDDGFGVDGEEKRSCDRPDGYAAEAGDCDDNERGISPVATEVCDGLDNDCNGAADGADAVDANEWFTDSDGDGFGANGIRTCEPAGPGQVDVGGDCDDGDPYANPDELEYCDGFDNDCDGDIDEGDAVDATEYYADLDGDGYGDPNNPLSACVQPPNYLLDTQDCDDNDALANPYGVDTAWEDRDCDGLNEDLGEAETELGGQLEEQLGAAIAGIGDINGDGFDDFVAGAPGVVDPLVDLASVWIMFGGALPTKEANMVDYGIQFTGEDPGDLTGAAVAGGGDFNGDGVLDIAASAPGAVSNRGSAYLIYGAADLTDGSLLTAPELKGLVGGEEAGASLALGEISGDPYADLVVGAPGESSGGLDAGSVYIVPGRTDLAINVDLPDVGVAFTGPAGSRTGASVAILGDVDGDGISDLAIGAPLDDSSGNASGSVFVVEGPHGVSAGALLTAADAQYYGENDGDGAGTSVGDAGDFDGDGYSDLIIGAPGWNGVDGAAYLVQGGPTMTGGSLASAWVKFTGQYGHRVGASVNGVGDMDGDGFDDVGIGEPDGSRGDVWVQLGQTSPAALIDESAVSVFIVGETTGDAAGSAVDGAGDFDGDGYDDLIIGGPLHNHFGQNDSGGAYLVLGDPL